ARLPGSYAGIQGSDQAAAVLRDLAAALDMHVIRLQPGQETLYHCAAVFASNYLVTLAWIGARLWQPLGLATSDAVRALLPLMQGTVDNLAHAGLPDALTGPIARGDA